MPHELPAQATPYGEVSGIVEGHWPVTHASTIHTTTPIKLYFYPVTVKAMPLHPMLLITEQIFGRCTAWGKQNYRPKCCRQLIFAPWHLVSARANY